MVTPLASSITPPPSPPPAKTLEGTFISDTSPAVLPSSSSSFSPSLVIIAAILAFVVLASAAIHLGLRLLSWRSPSTNRVVHFRPPSRTSPSDPSARAAEHEKEWEALIAALPTFTLAAAVAASPKFSADCAVCLSQFRPNDALRLLPSCRHAFHASCVDAWLRSSASCPLCRASVTSPPSPLAEEADARTGSFRVEIGSVSQRRSGGAAPSPSPPGRSYSLGSALEYLIEDEVEAVIARALRRHGSNKERKPGAPAPPGADLAEAVGERSGSWLRDYVDRLTASASSSFSSLRFSSCRYDGGAVADRGGSARWDLEGCHNRTPSMDEGASGAFFRWFFGGSP